ncbi:hypothetical protein E8E11_007252 [Didymella keratinophila]|nr:hypothetical protein E8E11_007252 [Didymella keratinophila]
MTLFEPKAVDLTTLKSTPKTIVITGGSSGIGLATAQLLSTLNPQHNLVLLDLNAPPSSLKHNSSNLLVHTCNITSWPSQRAGFEAAYSRFGRIDCVFVNAGIAEHGEQFFTDELDGDGKLKEPDRRVLNIDMDAAADTTKLAIHYLRKNQEGGEIVLTASLAGAPPDVYAKEMAAKGVPINQPEDIALAVCWLLNERNKANGAGLLIQGGKFADLERGLAKSREQWMGKEMLALFRGGRTAPLFDRLGAEAKAKI